MVLISLPVQVLVMVSATKLSFHKRLFLQLIAYAWALVLCFVGYQYLREKQYKSEFLSATLQQYNRHLLEEVDEGRSFETYISTHEMPFSDLRITLITLSGAVIFDNTIPIDSLDNHRSRPEVAEALRNNGCKVLGVVTIFDYGFPSTHTKLEKAELDITALTNLETVLHHAENLEIIDNEQSKAIQAWQRKPTKWTK